MESHPSENYSTIPSASISPKKNFPPSKTNQNSKYVINEQGKLVKLKSSSSSSDYSTSIASPKKCVSTKSTDSNNSKNEQRSEQLQPKYLPEETLKFSTKISASKTNNQGSKCFINEQGKLVKLKSSAATPPVINTVNNRGQPLKLRPNQVDSHEKEPLEAGKSTTEDSYTIYEKLNISTKPIDSNDSFNEVHSEKNRKILSQNRMELKEELSQNGYILCTKSTCQMGFLTIKGKY